MGEEHPRIWFKSCKATSQTAAWNQIIWFIISHCCEVWNWNSVPWCGYNLSYCSYFETKSEDLLRKLFGVGENLHIRFSSLGGWKFFKVPSHNTWMAKRRTRRVYLFLSVYLFLLLMSPINQFGCHASSCPHPFPFFLLELLPGRFLWGTSRLTESLLFGSMS